MDGATFAMNRESVIILIYYLTPMTSVVVVASAQIVV
jgi:hypothetical protein